MAALLGLGQRMRRCLPDDEIDYTLIPALRVLSHTGPVRHSTLAERLHLDASTVSRQVRHLQDRDLVRIAHDEQDGRARRVELTESGRTALDDHMRRRLSLIADVLADWPQAETDMLRTLLNRFNQDLFNQDPATPVSQEQTS